MPYTRRAVLASVAGLAGCVGQPGPAVSPTGTPAVSFGDFVHRHSFLHLVHPDTLGVTAPPDRQFLFVGVNAFDDESPPQPSDFVVVARERHPGWNEFDGRTPRTVPTGVGRDRPYDSKSLVGWVGFDLPVPVETDSVRIERTDGGAASTWALPEDMLAALGQPAPAFEVSNFEAPTAVAMDEDIAVTFDIENVGSVDGRFRGSLNNLGPLYAPSPIRERVAAGETVSHRHTITYFQDFESADVVRFRLVTPDRSFRHEVTVKRDG